MVFEPKDIFLVLMILYPLR